MVILLLLLIASAVLIEGTITSLPLTLVFLICLTVIKKDTSVFLPAFLAGIAIDVFRVQQVGATSIFYICFLFLILLYKKKYEIYSTPFVMLATFFGSFFFLLLFHFDDVLSISFINAIIATVAFMVLRFFADAKGHTHKEQFLPL